MYNFALWIDGGHVPSTSGKPIAASTLQLIGSLKIGFMKKLTQEEFIAKAIAVNGDKYDYSKVLYVNNRTKVLIICKKCGKEFMQKAGAHLRGQGCPCCSLQGKICPTKRTKIHKVGVYDAPYPKSKDARTSIAYQCWSNMLMRCYSKEYQQNHPSYVGCFVDKKWFGFCEFKKWFDENYIDGFCLDKDILVKGNKMYSPETCCFVPYAINNIFALKANCRGKLPLGVRLTPKGRFTARLMLKPNPIYLGTFNSVEEAFAAYKRTKERHIKEVTQEYFDKKLITEKVYSALINYKVEITD